MFSWIYNKIFYGQTNKIIQSFKINNEARQILWNLKSNSDKTGFGSFEIILKGQQEKINVLNKFQNLSEIIIALYERDKIYPVKYQNNFLYSLLDLNTDQLRFLQKFNILKIIENNPKFNWADFQGSLIIILNLGLYFNNLDEESQKDLINTINNFKNYEEFENLKELTETFCLSSKQPEEISPEKKEKKTMEQSPSF